MRRMHHATKPRNFQRRFLAAAVAALALLTGCGGSTRNPETELEPLRRQVTAARSLAAAPTETERARIRGGLIDRLAGRRFATLAGGESGESARDRFVRLKASQNVHIRRGLPIDEWYAANRTTPDAMRSLEDEHWLDPAVRADVLRRTQETLNANRRPMR